jgi:hypothetical protein
MQDTMAVMIPRGPTAKMTVSRMVVDSLRNCLVTCSPKREMMGARSVAKLLPNSDQKSVSLLDPNRAWTEQGRKRRRAKRVRERMLAVSDFGRLLKQWMADEVRKGK